MKVYCSGCGKIFNKKDCIARIMWNIKNERGRFELYIGELVTPELMEHEHVFLCKACGVIEEL